jgi:hypothetical protein
VALGAVCGALLIAPGLSAVAWASPQVYSAPSSVELVEHPGTYDGKTVTFQGEAIGEAMVRGDYAWIHLNDDAYMLKNVEEGAALGGYNTGMPVWIPADEARSIQVFGDYKHEGEIVRVEGTFNAACAQHGGDMDIHATSIEHVAPGRDAKDPVHPNKALLAVVLTLAAGALWWAEGHAGIRERAGLSRRR